MNLKFYTKAVNQLVSLKKSLVVGMVSLFLVGSASAQLSAGALNFDGINDIVSIPLKSELNISKAITIEAWINPTVDNVSATESVISKATTQFNNGYIFPRTSSGWETIEFLIYINGYGWKSLQVPYGADKIGQWHHLVGTYDGIRMQIYIDAVLAGEYYFAGTIATNNNALTIGNHPGFYENYEGDIDEVRIWNRALSKCEIANNMLCELAGTQLGLVAYYKFNQGLLNVLNVGVTQLIDSSPTGANGTLTNFGLSGLLSNWSAGNATGTCAVFAPLTITATADQTVLAIGGTIRLHASGGTTYLWTGPNGFTSTSADPVITGAPISASGNYTVTATSNGCSATANVNITVALKASALNFNGINNFITVPYKAGLLNPQAFTIESWIYPTSSNTIIQSVVSNGNRSSDMGVKFPKTNDRWATFSFELSIDNSWKVLSATFPASALNQWNHMAATYDGYYMRVYLNGALAGTLEVFGTVTTNTNNITIGNQDGRGEYFKGALDELRIWGRALSQCEIINNMQTCELNGDNSGLAQQDRLTAYYRFNQGLIGVDNSATNMLVDSSGRGNHGTLTNFTLTGSTSNWINGKVNGLCAYFPPPLLAASANGSAFQTGSTAKLFAVGGNNVYAWAGPNSFATSTQNPVLNNVQPSNSGTYTVTATYVNCVVNASTRFTVGNVSPIIADGPTTICPSGSVGLSTSTTSSGATYQWYKNDVAISGATDSKYIATQAGNYTVTTISGTTIIVSAPTTVVVLVDTIAPVIDVTTLSALSIVAGNTLTAIPTATDNCRGTVNGIANRSLTFNDPGTYTITWTYDDLNGNISTQTQNITVIDNVAPSLTVPSNISAQATAGICTAIVNFAASATDNSSSPVTITYSQNPNTAFAIGVNTVTITATDASNNSSTGSFTITITAPPVAPITGTKTICAGGTSTLASATAGGTWSSNNTAVATVSASGIVTAQTAGTATISYTDACGSAVTATVTVNAVPATPDVIVVNNCGNAVLTTSAAGTLLWSTNETSSSITVTSVGTYSVTQTINGCTSTAGSALAAPIVTPSAPVVSVTQPNCTASTGTIGVNSPSGFSYSIDGLNYQSNNTFSGLAAGSYTVYVKNVTCISTSATPVVINAQPVIPAAPTVSVTLQPSCSVSTGTIVVSAPSGFSYSLDGINYQTSTTFSGVAAGTYTAYAKNGSCISAGSVPVTVNAQPAIPSAPTVSVTQPTCTSATGTIVVNSPSGLSYSIDGLTYQSGNSFSGIAAGTYTVYVNNGSCVSTSSSPVVVNAQPVTPAAPTVSVTLQPSCSVATGTIVVSAPSGFSYSLDGINYQTSTTFSGVAAGTYTAYAKNGSCISAGSVPVTVNVQPATPSTPTVSVTQPTCTSATGTIVVNSPSGLSYSIDGLTYQSGNSFSGIAAGTYTVYVNNGSCVSTSSSPVVVNAQPVTPAAPTVSVTLQPSCSVATGTIVVSASSGFSYSLDGINYQTSTTFSGVAVGTYIVYAKSGSCISAGSTAVTVNAQPVTPTAPAVSVTLQPTCSVSTGTIVVSSPVGFSYSLDGITYQTSTIFSGVAAGTYIAYAKSGSCVSAGSTAVTVNAQPATPTTPVVSVTQQPSCSVATGTIVVSSPAGFSYSIDGINYQTSSTFSGVATGTYIVYAKSGSCISAGSTAVTVNTQPASPSVPVISVTQPTCSLATGSINISSPTGAGFTYSIDGTNYQSSTSFTGLTAGITYTVFVKNASSCITSASAVVNAQPATPIVGNITGTTTFAVGANSTLSSSTSGGVWSSSNTAVATVNATTGFVTGISIGSATITYTVTTGCSNSKTTTVNIVPSCVTPLFTAINNINANTVSGCTAPVSYTVSVTGTPAPALTFTFSGATSASGSGTGSGASFNTGVTTVTIAAVNACGAVTTSFTITVRDATPPTAITKNISVSLDANGLVTLAPSQVDNGSSDNCGTVTLAFRTGTTSSPATTGTICGTADENGNLVLTAPAGGVITSINFASYGTPTGTCGSFTLGACNAIGSKTVVEGYALGRNSVTIPANNAVFGDPCVGTYKRLYVQATYQISVAVNSTTASSLSFGCANKGANTVTLNVTDAAGNVSTQTAIVTVQDNTAPVITTVVPNQSFCGNTGYYTIPVLSATDNCTATLSYIISGATSRSGTGNNASGTFNAGTSLITWSVTDGTNTVIGTTTVMVTPIPAAGTITTNTTADFCGEFVLTGSSSVSSNASYKWMSGSNTLSTSQQLSLGQNNADGIYQMYVSVNGCVSPAASYNFQKQNILGSYTILVYDDVKMGQYSKVATGSIGVMSSKGNAEFKSYTSVAGPNAFVKSPDIDLHGFSINIPTQINGVASVLLPAMQYNTAYTNNLPNYSTSQNATVTLSSNYNKLTVRKGSYATVSGNTFGTIELEEGASIRFTNPTLNIENLIVNDGARDGNYSYVRFAANTSVRVSTKVSIGSQVLVNPDNNKVTFYMGDNKCDQEKFYVKGADTKIVANIYMPNGKLKVTTSDENDDNHGNCDHKAHYWWNCKHNGHNHKACDHKAHNTSDCGDDVYMTGLFIVEDLESKGNTVIWNSFNCSSGTLPVVMANNATATHSSVTAENNAVTKSTDVTTEEELKITVMPNPSTTYFTLRFESKYEMPVNMRVMDANGRVVDAKSKIGSNSTIQIGANYASGTYYAEMIQGTQRKVVQLMKVK